MEIQIHLMLLFIRLKRISQCVNNNSNTSHVTLYPITFAYLFPTFWDSNTSHVTLYHLQVCAYPMFSVNSNTSHVTLYRDWENDSRQSLVFKYISCYSLSCVLWRVEWCWFIQIHLMLLFIWSGETDSVKGRQFKYISCYSLSTGTGCKG